MRRANTVPVSASTSANTHTHTHVNAHRVSHTIVAQPHSFNTTSRELTLALGAVALAMGAEPPVGRGARQGTELTMGAPSPAASAAALDSGHSLTAA